MENCLTDKNTYGKHERKHLTLGICHSTTYFKNLELHYCVRHRPIKDTHNGARYYKLVV